MEKRQFKNSVYTLLAQLVKAMANPHRLEILDLLAQTGRTVEDIAAETSMSIANTSQHLQVLKASNLVEIQREGNYIRYQLADDKVYAAWNSLREVGFDRVAAVDVLINDYRKKRGVLEALSIDELLLRMETQSIVLLDIRPEEEFNAGHLPNALSIPSGKLSETMKTLSKNKEYVAYCRGPLCVFADDAVNFLIKKGFKAIRLKEGFPEWKLKGLPIETLKK
jgi:rhodanese-related sulfurtransferase